MKIAIIGAGASGMFCAATLAENLRIDIFEASKYPLAKVRASGGGRCNFTNENIDTADLSEFYPRGAGSLKKPIRKFGSKNVRDFFESLGVQTKTEDNGRVFPCSNDSRSIVFVLQDLTRYKGVKIRTNEAVENISKRSDDIFEVTANGQIYLYDIVVVCVGGLSDNKLKKSLENLGIKIEPLVPSLFGLELDVAKENYWNELSGMAVPNAELSANFENAKKNERKISAKGSLLLTHFGIGGPAALKFSSFGARVFNQANYQFPFVINFASSVSESERIKTILEARKTFAKKRVFNVPLFNIPQKLWTYLAEKSSIPRETIFASLTKQAEQALIKNIFSLSINAIGKSAHKAEFVTCGGIAREEIDFTSMQCKKIENLFFAGECIDIDAITGGFNLQAAWTTAKICSDYINLKTQNSTI